MAKWVRLEDNQEDVKNKTIRWVDLDKIVSVTDCNNVLYLNYETDQFVEVPNGLHCQLLIKYFDSISLKIEKLGEKSDVL